MSWPIVTLKEVTNLVTCGVAKRPDYVDDGVPFLSAKNVKNGEIVYRDYNYISQETHETLTKHNKPEIGDILYTRVGSVGEAAVIEKDIEFSVFVSLTLIKPKHDVIDKQYLKYLLNSEPFKARALGNLTGIGVGNLNVSVVREYPIPLPPLDEQKRIAAILDKADAIRRKRQKAIALADDFLRSVFLDMFGDPAINPNTYDETTLGELKVEKMNNGIFKKNGEYGGETPVAWVSELFRGRNISFRPDSNSLSPTVKEVEKYGLRFGDLLFCRSSLKLEGIGFNNVYLGKDNEALFECHLIRLRPDFQKVDPVFLNYQLRMPNIRKRVFQQSKTVTMTTIDQEGLSNVKVVVPPLDEQKKFMEIVKSTELILNKAENTVSLNNDSFNSLSQKAFAGEL